MDHKKNNYRQLDVNIDVVCTVDLSVSLHYYACIFIKIQIRFVKLIFDFHI